VIKEIGPACVIYGSTIDVQAHHLDPIGEGGDKRGPGVPLCGACHRLTHRSRSGDTARAMSQENVEVARATNEVVRKRLRVRERSSRTLDQWLFLRFPRLAAANSRWIAKLPPSSRLRQAALWRAARLGLEAYNRRDLDASLVGYHPEFEIFPARAWVEAGLVEPCYRGPEGYRQYVAIWDEVWGADSYLRPVELIDLGERFVILTQAPMRARASGVPLTGTFALVSTLKDGTVIRQDEYWDHAEALEAVGLSE
jgi:ketosteroid isomerase-like protein